MKRVGLIALVLLTIAAIAAVWLRSKPGTPEYATTLVVRYGLAVENTSSGVVNDGRIQILAPLASTPRQQVKSLEVALPHQYIENPEAPSVEIQLGVLPPYAQEVIWLEAQLGVADMPNAWESPTEGEWLAPTQFIESDHSEIIQLARQFEGADAASAIPLIRDWIAANLRPGNYDGVDRGALAALKDRRGDCSEYAFLSVALARSLGHPARVVEGWVVDQGGVLESAGFHAWAEVWDGTTWRELDAHSRHEERPDSRFIGFRYRGSAGERSGDPPLKFSVEGAGLVARLL